MGSATDPENTYDYIVCGGGTSGCVVAGRLAENKDVRVLLIEAGQHNRDLENVHMPGGSSGNFDSETDWNLVTKPMAGVDDRTVKLSRGRFLGGSSGCNGTLCIRGTKQDYDDWGLEGWSGEEFFEAMKKSETFHPKPWFKATESAHGYSGPLHTEPHDLAPIASRLIDSFVDKGLPLHHDMFSTGDVANGCGHVPRTVHKGIRTTAADFITKEHDRSNLTIHTDTTVDRALIEQTEDGLRATGVVTRTADGSEKIFHARREVIVSGGAYCSPAILMRSGIGAGDELAQHGIECQVDLPGVGKNLMDHLIVFIFYETKQPNLTNCSKIYHGNAFQSTYAEWKEHKTGFLSSFPFGSVAFTRIDDRLADSPLWKNAPRLPGRDPMGLTPSQPNIGFLTTECYGGPKQYNQFPGDGQHAFSIIAELFAPKSRGGCDSCIEGPECEPGD
ncbi:Putative Glucose-methanol-choline oxidoreductase (Eurofung) [Aspergillus calidoustus]|uniref:Putative Glucose-methanol-choline oxidoreductase (Eurofung) n=1 Tax=Aspergillus calidoustus TaxID=454130 RepID=A0A0U5C6T5_ASPCI|nr:Putative Glucose-methanol-choline oxidoreductase (Eurofung) [Aspergillus calidoustus]